MWKLTRLLQVGQRNLKTLLRRRSHRLVLGIETSCDDTAAAVVSEDRKVLGDVCVSQLELVLRLGGVIPPVAQMHHKKNIGPVVEEAMSKAGVQFSDLSAIAASVKPGLTISLKVGVDYALKLCREHRKPFIPIHHMHAHALTARLLDRTLSFPFLCFLMSGGHCILTLCQGPDQFLVLGEATDGAPGEAFDKVARRLKLTNLGGEFSRLSGGAAIEKLAENGDAMAYEFPMPNKAYRDCHFSFSGLKTSGMDKVARLEAEQGISACGVIDGVEDFCASFQHGIFRHMARRLMRAIQFLDRTEMVPPDSNRSLVISGGVAGNQYLTGGLEWIASHFNYRTIVPPAKLCSDNGIMIAWNGIELLNRGSPIIHEIPESYIVERRCPLGENIAEQVISANISPNLSIKLNSFPSVYKKLRNDKIQKKSSIAEQTDCNSGE